MKLYAVLCSVVSGKFIILFLSAVILGGCASIISGTSQTITVETRLDNEEVIEARCQLQNKKGKYEVSSPGAVVVQRANDDLIIACHKEDLPKGLARGDSGLNGVTFWNILLGGIIGAGVDMGTGAINDYPDLIIVQFGKNVFIESADEFVEIEESEVYGKKTPEKRTHSQKFNEKQDVNAKDSKNE